MKPIPRRDPETGSGLSWPFGAIDGLFEGFLRAPEAADAWAPPLEVQEEDDAYRVQVELPGVDPKDVDITVHGTQLTISGEKKTERSEKLRSGTRTERVYGAFRRTITLPEGVDPAGVTAEGAHGVLTLRIPKPEAAVARKIQVRTS